MYIPKINLATDKTELIAFMQQYSFATIVTADAGSPVATHLPFLVSVRDEDIILTSHFAKANLHWQLIADNINLVIFSEPHAYISPRHYDSELNVPTWNYISVHAYGKAQLITNEKRVFEVLDNTICNYENTYKQQYDTLTLEYKTKMAKGIVAFEIAITDLQGKKKLSQNKTKAEQERIIESLAGSNQTNEKDIAVWMKKNRQKLQ